MDNERENGRSKGADEDGAKSKAEMTRHSTDTVEGRTYREKKIT